jgi:hypothetical protein
MSRFTDQLYRHWLGQNGSPGPRRCPRGGMGGMPPMVATTPASAPGNSRGAPAANDEAYSRLDKQGCDYVDNIIKSVPAPFFKGE